MIGKMDTQQSLTTKYSWLEAALREAESRSLKQRETCA